MDDEINCKERKCKYYDSENDICSACECWPVMDCNESLPCEKEKE